MPFPYYAGDSQNKAVQDPSGLPTLRGFAKEAVSGYRPEPGLVDAVNVALMLGQPLLVTGEPGTGKTQLAHSIAWELNLGSPLVFETKSTSVARDLLYTYDTLSRFHAAQTQQGSQRNLDYITYNALGLAILRTRKRRAVERLIPNNLQFGNKRCRSVVLIDEIDKAPRDFPNDLLNEIEHLYFRVPELENVEIRAARSLRPVVVITSNSEKHLPDAFLRRCTYYNISFPTPDRLMEIVLGRLRSVADKESSWLSDAIGFFLKLREDASDLEKKPATAELLEWLRYLHERGAGKGKPFRQDRELLEASLGTLRKSKNDQSKAKDLLQHWLS